MNTARITFSVPAGNPTPAAFAASWIAAQGMPSEGRLRSIGECYAQVAGLEGRMAGLAVEYVIGAFMDIQLDGVLAAEKAAGTYDPT
jgi:hypothetical protein